MKRFILLFLTIILVLCISGCNETIAEATQSSQPFPHTTYDTRIGFVSVIVDHETGVNYIFFKGGYGGGLSPRYNADGSLYVSEVE